MAEQQLRPILTYMKAQVVQSYVFAEARDIHRGEVVSDDVTLRIEQLIKNTIVLTRVYSQLRMAQEAVYAF